MLILLDSYIWVLDLVYAHLMPTWLLAGPVLGRGPRPAGCRGLATEGGVVAWLGWRSCLFTYNCWNPRGYMPESAMARACWWVGLASTSLVRNQES